MARLIAFDSLTPVAWKNGGGSTTELAVFPPGAGFDTFIWRVSLATIAASGPFSRFEGIDRSLALVDGEKLALTVDGEKLTLEPTDAPLRFTGEAQVAASVDGVTTDLNVMTRRARCRHALRRVALSAAAPTTIDRRGAHTLIFLSDGDSASIGDGTHSFKFKRFDALLLDEGDAGRWQIHGDGALLVADIDLLEN
jgi:environmental stress-induced protein Ves